ARSTCSQRNCTDASWVQPLSTESLGVLDRRMHAHRDDTPRACAEGFGCALTAGISRNLRPGRTLAAVGAHSTLSVSRALRLPPPPRRSVREMARDVKRILNQ